MVTAIETVYRGETFRSRTEARWAAFLDALEVRREHEPQPFQTAHGPYLPDFFLPDLGVWLEVKGQRPTQAELASLLAVTRATGARGVVMVGAPANPGYPKHADGYGHEVVGVVSDGILEAAKHYPSVTVRLGNVMTLPVFVAVCAVCERVGLTIDGCAALIDCGHKVETYARDCWRIRRAAEAAARVRWEAR